MGTRRYPLNDSFFSYLYIVTRNCFQIARRVRILITHESCQEVGLDFLSTSGFKSKEKVHEFCWTEAVRIFFERRSKSSMNDLKNVHPNIKFICPHTSTNLPFHDFSIS